MFPVGADVNGDKIIRNETAWSWTMAECNDLTNAFITRMKDIIERLRRSCLEKRLGIN